MREIKFRAWDKEWGQMEYAFEKTIVAEDGTEFLAIAYRFMNGGMPVVTTLATCLKYPSRYVVMQFTGLKDKNGKEIYEGDILGYWGTACWPIKYFSESNRYGMYYLDVPEASQFWLNQKEVEKKQIIGNIYENPDLLV